MALGDEAFEWSMLIEFGEFDDDDADDSDMETTFDRMNHLLDCAGSPESREHVDVANFMYSRPVRVIYPTAADIAVFGCMPSAKGDVT